MIWSTDCVLECNDYVASRIEIILLNVFVFQFFLNVLIRKVAVYCSKYIDLYKSLIYIMNEVGNYWILKQLFHIPSC